MTSTTRADRGTEELATVPFPSVSVVTSPIATVPPAAEAPPSGVVKHSALLSVSAGLVGVTSYACTLLMANALGPREFGHYAAGQMLVGVVGIVASVLVPLPLATAIRGGRPGSEDRKQGMAFALLVSAAMGVAAGVLAGGITAAFAPLPVAAAVGAAAASLFAISPTWGWLQGELRFVRYACCTVAEVAVRLLCSLAAVLLGWGAAGAIGGFVAGAVVVVAVGLWALHADLAWRPAVLREKRRWVETGDIALTQLVVSTLVGADVVLVGLLGSGSATEAGFQALATLAKGPVYVAAGTVLVTFPLLRSSGVHVDAVLRPALRSFAHLALPAAAVLATVPLNLVLLVLPDAYAPAVELLPWLAVAGLGYATMTVSATVLLALRAHRRSQLGLVAAAVLLPSGLLLGWRLDGVAGLAVGGAVGVLVATLVLGVLIAPLLPTGLGRPALRGAAAIGLLVAVLQFVRGHPLVWLAAVGLAGAVVVASMQGRLGHVSRPPKPAPGPSRPDSVVAQLRILHLGCADPRMPGATPEAWQDHMVNRRIATRDAVTVLVPNFPGCTEGRYEGVLYAYLPAGRWRRLISLLQAGRRYRAELVVSSAPSGVRAATILSRLPSIGVVRPAAAGTGPSIRGQRAARRHTHLIAPTDEIADRVRAAFPGRSVHTLPAAVDRTAFLATPQRGNHVFYLGPLDIRRGGVDLLLQAWALACPQVPGLLVLSGEGPDETALRSLAHRLSITRRVRFIGSTAPGDRHGRLTGARVVAIPSRVDPGPAVLEALATGTPVVAFQIRGGAPVLVPPGCGHRVPPSDIVGFGTALVRTYLARTDPAAVAARARRAAALQNWNAAGDAQRALYHCLARPTEASAGPVLAPPDPATTRIRLVPRPGTGRLFGVVPTGILATVVGAAAFATRGLGVQTANDLFIDELTYSQIAAQVADGQWPNQFGFPFFLHPPASFLINAAVVQVLGLHGTEMDLSFDLRWVNAVLGSLTATVLFLTVRRVTTLPVALLAAIVVIFDPFVLRNDSKVMLETPATLPIAIGWLLLLVAMSRGPGRATGWLEAGAGLLFGLGLATKDLTAVATVVPLLLALVWRHTLPPRTVVRVLLASTVPYAVFLLVVVGNGYLPAWWSAKLSGIRRIAGLDQETGFNAPHAPSLVSRLIEQLFRFGTSYVLIGICVFAALVAAFSAHRSRRFIGLVGLCTGSFGAFAVLGGAAEEQIGYYVAITAVLALAVSGADLTERRPALRRPLLAAAVGFAALTVALGAHSRSISDDGYLEARAWLQVNVPPATPVGLTSVTGEFGLLGPPGYGVWPSLTSLAANNAQYVLTEGGPLSQGYGYAAPELLGWLEANADPVFDHYGPSKGHVVIWRIRPGALAQAVAGGVDFPPVSGGYP